MDGNFPFTIIEDDLFRAQADALGIDAKQLDAKLHDLTFVISRIPTSFPRAYTTAVRRAIYDGAPRLRIWFTFDGTHIVFRSIEKYGLNEPQDD